MKFSLHNCNDINEGLDIKKALNELTLITNRRH